MQFTVNVSCRDKQRKKYMEIYPLSGNTWRSTHFQELEKSSSGLLFFQMCMICRDETSLRFLACMLKTLKLFWNFKPGSYVCFRFFMFIFSLPLFFHLIPECLFSLFHQQGKPNIKKKRLKLSFIFRQSSEWSHLFKLQPLRREKDGRITGSFFCSFETWMNSSDPQGKC